MQHTNQPGISAKPKNDTAKYGVVNRLRNLAKADFLYKWCIGRASVFVTLILTTKMPNTHTICHADILGEFDNKLPL